MPRPKVPHEVIRERVRRAMVEAMEEKALTGDLRGYTVARVREIARTDTKKIARVKEEWMAAQLPPLWAPWGPSAGVGAPMSAAAPGAPNEVEAFAQAVEDASSLQALGDCTSKLAKLVALGAIDANRARALNAVIGERRKILTDAGKLLAQQEEAEKQYLITQEAYDMVKKYDSILLGEHRQLVLDACEAAYKKDVEALPLEKRQNPEWVAAQLKARGLDAWGNDA